MIDPHDLAKVYYNAARAEIVQRLALRESVLPAAVATFGVLAGFVLGKQPPDPWLLALFPFLSLAFTLVLLRHTWIINDQSDYINDTLAEFLGLRAAEPSQTSLAVPLHWDAALRQGGRSRNLQRVLLVELFGAWFLLWGPGAWALYLVITHRHEANVTLIVVSGLALLAALVLFAFETRRLFSRWRTWRPVRPARTATNQYGS